MTPLRLYTNDLLDKIDPEAVRSYLMSVWLFDSGMEIKTDECKVIGFRMTNRNINSTILVATKAAADWRHRLVGAIEDIAELEDRSSFYVIADLLGWRDMSADADDNDAWLPCGQDPVSA